MTIVRAIGAIIMAIVNGTFSSYPLARQKNGA